ncbi:MAG: HdeD family acid-resistance protein [Alphaproteobacteria bacterium]|nr:HdeD family acid-resistance protein [Alphaproteobacteria bacterium]
METGNARPLGSLHRYWGWMLALGVLMLVLGVIGLYASVALTIVSVLLFGALLVAGGVAQAIQAFRASGWKSVALHVGIALLYIVGGGIALYDPVAASLSLTIFIAAMLLVTGIFRAAMAFQMRPIGGWGWVLFGGIMSFLLGLLIFAQWPVSGLFAIGLFVAIELIVDGWSCILFALAAKSTETGHSAEERHA